MELMFGGFSSTNSKGAIPKQPTADQSTHLTGLHDSFATGSYVAPPHIQALLDANKPSAN